jgi:hypothetical protein
MTEYHRLYRAGIFNYFILLLACMAEKQSSRGATNKSGPTKKRALIREYEKTHDVDLTGEELDCIIDEAFSNPDISSDTKSKVKKKLKDKKKGKKAPEKKSKK